MKIKTNGNDKIYLSIDFEDFSHDFKRRLRLTKSNNINEKASISLRPERVILNPHDNIPNRFEAKVREIIYHGDHTRVRVNLLGQDNFILKVPNSSDISNINQGDKMSLGWEIKDSRALDSN